MFIQVQAVVHLRLSCFRGNYIPCPFQVPENMHEVTNKFIKKGWNSWNIHTYWFTSGKYSCTPHNCSSLFWVHKGCNHSSTTNSTWHQNNDTMECAFVKKIQGYNVWNDIAKFKKKSLKFWYIKFKPMLYTFNIHWTGSCL